jgi:hypothetical protein
MKQSKLSVRVNRKNANHHLWDNNGKWWCHLTVHKTDYTVERRRFSLNTRDVNIARERRDRLLCRWSGEARRGLETSGRNPRGTACERLAAD